MTGMVKNQKLAENILTPTTKAADHDVPVTPDEVWSLFLSFSTYLFIRIEVIVKDDLHGQKKWIRDQMLDLAEN